MIRAATPTGLLLQLLFLAGASQTTTAQPVGMIDPLYEHSCNIVIDPALVNADKYLLLSRMMKLEGPYKVSQALESAGKFREALEQMLMYQAAIAPLLAPTHHVVLDSRLRSATLRAQLRQYDEALREMQEVLALREQCLGEYDEFTLQALSALAELHHRAGNVKQGLSTSQELARRADARFNHLPPDEQASQKERKAVLIARWNLTAIQYRAGQYDEARAGATRTLSQLPSLSVDDIERHEIASSAWYVLNRLAFLSDDLPGQHAAIQGLRESYQGIRSRLGEQHSRTLSALANLGFAAADVDPAEAVFMLGDYVALVEQRRQQSSLPTERQILLEGRANTYLRFAFAAHDAKRTEYAFYGIEWSKSRALRDDLSLKDAMRDALLTPVERAALDVSQRRISQLQNALDSIQLQAMERLEAERALLDATGAYDNQLREAQARNPRLRIAAESLIEPPGNAAELLQADEVFISYLTRRVHGPVFEILIAVLEPDGRLTIAGPIRAPGLEQSVNSWVRIAATNQGLAGVAQSGDELFRYGDAFFFQSAVNGPKGAKKVFRAAALRDALSQMLLPPDVHAIAAKYNRWVLSPGGILWSVPFETLNDGDGLVVDSRIVRYIHSWTMFSLLNQTVRETVVTSGTPLLAIGDAQYSGTLSEDSSERPDEEGWRELSFSAKELDHAAELYGLVPGKNLFRGSHATRSTVLALDSSGVLGGARIILLSAHGYLDRARPELSAIVLGRPERGAEADRYLRAREIAQLKLNANLVIVSSCDSGSGRIASGEGVLGLPYAFFSAGASAAVLTLWQVNDNAETVALIGHLLGGLKQGLPADEALTMAKRALRKTSGDESWAAFSLLSR